MENGNFKKAKRYFEQSLAINEKTYGPEHLNVAELLEELGELRVKAADYSGARKALERALSIRKKVKGLAEKGLTPALFRLGTLYAAQDEVSKAKQKFEKVLAICRGTFCGFATLHGSEFGLAKILWSSGEKAHAEKLARAALCAFSKKPKRFKKKVLQIKNWIKTSL